MTDDRWHTAVHEAAHAVTAHLTGRTVELVSIRAGVSHAGITRSTVPADERVDLDALLGGEVCVTDPRARGFFESAIISTLAGDIAAGAVTPRSGYLPPARPPTMRAVESYVEIAPRHRERLAYVEARSTVESDEDAVERWAFQLAKAEAGAYLAWLRAVAVRMVNEHADSIRAVAEELVQADVLDGDRFVELVEGGAADEAA